MDSTVPSPQYSPGEYIGHTLIARLRRFITYEQTSLHDVTCNVPSA